MMKSFVTWHAGLISRIPDWAPRMVLLCFLAGHGWAEDISIEVTADRDKIYLGESVLLQIKVNGTSAELDLDFAAVPNGRIRKLGSQQNSFQSITIVNGRMHREGFSGRVYTCEFTPTGEGACRAGPVRIQFKGKSYSDPGPSIAVIGITQQDFVQVAVEASRTPVLVDEEFDITMRIRLRRLPGRWADTDPLFPNAPPVLSIPYLDPQNTEGLKAPDMEQTLGPLRHADPNRPGFNINGHTVRVNPFNMRSPFPFAFGSPFEEQVAKYTLARQAVIRDGNAYYEYSLTLRYSPEKEGNYTFGPVIFKGTVAVAGDGRNTPQPQEFFAVGPAATVRVVPPPEEGRPDSYIGAIGSNLTVEATLDAQSCNVGDPLKLVLTIAGNVQFGNLTPPRLSLQTNLLQNFTVYDNQVQTVKGEGRRQYIYTLRPTRTGTFELPPLEVTFYDVTTRRYRTVTSLPIPVRANQVLEITGSNLVGARTNAPALDPALTTSLLHSTPTALRLDPEGAEPVPLLGDPHWLIAGASGPVLFGLIVGTVRFRRFHVRHRRESRRRQAAQRVAAQVGALTRHPVPSAESHRILSDAMRGYLADRLDVKASAIAPADASHLMESVGLPSELARRFRDVLEYHFNAGYHAGHESGRIAEECRQVLDLVHAVATQAEKSRGKQDFDTV